MSFSKFNRKVFTSDGNFTVPAGVTKLVLFGMGGGQGGNGGAAGYPFFGIGGGAGRAGGIGTCLLPTVVDVVPNTTYSVTIGQGGAGGAGGTSFGGSGSTGGSGGDTSFGALMTWEGPVADSDGIAGFNPFPNLYIDALNSSDVDQWYPEQSFGNSSGSISDVAKSGYPGKLGVSASGGTRGTGMEAGGGGGGGMTGEAIGGAGGNGGQVAQNGSDGADAPANSGAGGGGGGGGGSNDSGTEGAGGTGGDGGSGLLVVMWVE